MAPLKALISIVGLQGIGAVLSFVAVLALAAILGPENFGRYVWVVSIGSVLALLAEMGLPTTIIKSFAPLDLRSVRGPSQISNSLSLYALGTGGAILLVLAVEPLFAETGRPELVWALPLAGGLACLVLSAAVLRAGDRAILSNVIQFIVRPVFFLGGVGIVTAFGSTDLRLYLLLYTVASLTAALIFVLPLIQNATRNRFGGGLIAPVGAHFQVSIARSVSNHLPIFLTGFFVAPELLAYLAIAIRLTAPIRFGLASARSYFGTRINAGIKSRDFFLARRRYRNATLFSIAMALPVSISILGLIYWLTRIQFGPIAAYDDTDLLMQVMTITAASHLAIAMFGPVQLVAILLHEETFVRNLSITALILFAIGLVGAAWVSNLGLSAAVMVLYSLGISVSLAVRIRATFRKQIEKGGACHADV